MRRIGQDQARPSDVPGELARAWPIFALGQEGPFHPGRPMSALRQERPFSFGPLYDGLAPAAQSGWPPTDRHENGKYRLRSCHSGSLKDSFPLRLGSL